jgi:hypothetical protein
MLAALMRVAIIGFASAAIYGGDPAWSVSLAPPRVTSSPPWRGQSCDFEAGSHLQGGNNHSEFPPTRHRLKFPPYDIGDCFKMWDPGTHMTKEEWARACNRQQKRLESLDAAAVEQG